MSGFKKSIFIIYPLLLIFCSQNTIFAQSQKVKQRLDIIKKMKLMDALELDDKTEEKVLQTYSDWENKIEDQQDKLTGVAKDLNNALNKSQADKTIQKLTDDYIKAQQLLLTMSIDKNKEIRKILGARNFAKFIVFEHFFNIELRKMIFQKIKKDKNEK
jgi:hypothetical protein